MANLTEFFKLKKPSQGDFYDINDQNGNMDIIDAEMHGQAEKSENMGKEIKELQEPTFEDYSGDSEIPSAQTALNALKSKMKLPLWMSNVVAFCKGCCTLAMIVNNCVTRNSKLPLSAEQGAVLMDLINQTNVNIGNIRYADYATDDVAYQRKPLEFLKTKWEDLNANSIYLIRLQCGSVYLALVQTYSTHANGSVTIVSYNYGNPLYAQLINGTWTENSLITNNDLYEMPYVYNTSLKTYLKNYLKNGYYKIMFFGSLTDNPFKNITYGILLAAYATSYGEHAKLVGVNPETGVIESVSMDIR